MLGYFYQARYALLLLLRQGRQDLDISLTIEKFDDVTFDIEGTPKELLQFKHHIKPNSLGDMSIDLWKTFFIWIQDFKESRGLKNKTYTLITTSSAPEDTATQALSTDNRDTELALEKLLDAIQASDSQGNKTYYDSFLGLAPEERLEFLDSVYILCSSPI
jgi:hypothetical protein